MSDQSEEWFDDYAEGADELQIDEYDITATPNDFNVLTLHNFVNRAPFEFPAFNATLSGTRSAHPN